MTDAFDFVNPAIAFELKIVDSSHQFDTSKWHQNLTIWRSLPFRILFFWQRAIRRTEVCSLLCILPIFIDFISYFIFFEYNFFTFNLE